MSNILGLTTFVIFKNRNNNISYVSKDMGKNNSALCIVCIGHDLSSEEHWPVESLSFDICNYYPLAFCQ